jgi:hypothetical protein
MSPPRFEQCEFFRVVNLQPVYCQNGATLNVGASRNNWHLCESCAELPRFRRHKKTLLPDRLKERPR